jgi:dephospho-CoA kinase
MPKRQKNKKIVIGLTGSLGSGKTTAARMFKAAGAELIDADKLSRGLLKKGTPVFRKVANCFGKTILAADGALDRGKLGKVVFRRSGELVKLNRIVHPAVIRLIKKRIRRSSARLIVLDAPLLLEAGLKGIVDKVAVVRAGLNQQVKRVKEKTGLSRREILRRIRTQMPFRQKARLADFIIDNSAGIMQTRRQVQQIWRKLWKS